MKTLHNLKYVERDPLSCASCTWVRTGAKKKGNSKQFAIFPVCNKSGSQDAPEKAVATQKYSSLLF